MYLNVCSISISRSFLCPSLPPPSLLIFFHISRVTLTVPSLHSSAVSIQYLSLSLFLTPFRFVLFSFFFFGFTRRVYIVYVCLILRWAEPLVSSRDPHLIRNLLQRLLQRLSYPFKSFSPFHSPSFDRWKGIATPRDAKIDDQKARRICLSGISFLRSNRGYSRGFHGEPNSFDYKD